LEQVRDVLTCKVILGIRSARGARKDEAELARVQVEDGRRHDDGQVDERIALQALRQALAVQVFVVYDQGGWIRHSWLIPFLISTIFTLLDAISAPVRCTERVILRSRDEGGAAGPDGASDETGNRAIQDSFAEYKSSLKIAKTRHSPFRLDDSVNIPVDRTTNLARLPIGKVGTRRQSAKQLI
jgi:hypothetical protein